MNDNQHRHYPGEDPDYDEQYRRQLQEYSNMDSTNYFDSYVDLEFQQYDPSTDAPPRREAPIGNQRLNNPHNRQQRRAPNHTQQRKNAPHRNPQGSRKQQTARYPRREQEVYRNQKRPVRETRQGGAAPLEENQVPKKKKSILKRILIAVLSVVFVLFVIFNIIVLYLVGKVNVIETKKRDDSITADIKDKNVKNILIIGSDTRDFTEPGRTDSMILLSVNTKKKQITMTSLMRDMYLPLVGYSSDGTKMYDDEEPDGLYRNKLNAAYFYGGPELLMDTIKHSFGIELDDYIYFDFNSFIKVVDAIGGIQLDVSNEEAEVMNSYIKEHNRIKKQSEKIDLLNGGGKLDVNGSQALAYTRVRYVGNADFQRTQRQRTVLNKIIEKVKSVGIFKKYSFIKTTMENLTTNMSRSELYFYAYKLPFYMGYEIKELRLPAEGDYEYGSHKGGQSTLDIDINKCRKLLKEQVYN